MLRASQRGAGLADAARGEAQAGARSVLRDGLRTWQALLVAVAGGLGLAAAFPPVGIWPLAVVGPALLVVALWQRSLRGSFLVGLIFGVAYFVPLLSWVVNVAWYAWAGLAGADTVLFAVLTLGQRLLLRLRAWPLAVGVWWVAAESLRDRWPFGGFPWGRLAMSQAGAPTVNWVAVGGPYLLTFLLALTGACLAWLILGSTSGAVVRRRAVPLASLIVAAGVALAGALLPVDGAARHTPTAVVAAIQGNVPHARNLPDLLREDTVTTNHADVTLRLAGRVRAGQAPAPDVVIWPENSTDQDPRLNPFIYSLISNAVNTINRPVLVGAVLQNPVRNAGLLWLPHRGPGQAYIKRRLVPFGQRLWQQHPWHPRRLAPVPAGPERLRLLLIAHDPTTLSTGQSGDSGRLNTATCWR